MENQRIVPIAIEDEMRRAFIDYSMSVIIGRALPDVRDGLKPVHRRILYAMHDMGLTPSKPYRKSARLVGEVLGKYHPHGDSSIYDASVRMAQDFSMRYPLVDGQGNFGSVDGDPPAAMRYTESRMTPAALEMLVDLDKNTVEWRNNFDESLQEPDVLPCKFPNLLLNGSTGIAVGMATNIPPHNLKELALGAKMLIENPEAAVEDLMTVIKGPDFPTGALICGREGIYRAYKTGHGSVLMRCRAFIESVKENREIIRISEIPYQVNKAQLLKDIAGLVNNKIITGISDLRDESDKDGMRIIIELKRGEIGQVVLNQLYKHTSLQCSFGCNMLSIHKGMPKVMNLKDMLQAWIDHRKEVVTRATIYDLDKAEKRAHILEGFKIALGNIDGVIAIIKTAPDRSSAREKLEITYGLSTAQANAILEMRLYQITALESDKIDSEYKELQEKIQYYNSLLADDSKILQIIKDDTLALAAQFGDERRTSIEGAEGDFNAEDLIADEPCIITVSHSGYCKRVPTNTYKTQRRGGRGVAGMETRQEDYVEHLFSATTHDTMMIFSDKGMLYWLKVYAVPEASRIAKGISMANLINISPDEKIASMITVREFDDKHSIVMATEKGVIKKTNLSLFSNIRKKGIIAMNIREDDRLMAATLTDGNNDIFMATSEGYAIRFNEKEVSEMGRSATGVRGVTLRDQDKVVGMQVVPSEKTTVLVICENGFGKRTPFEEFRLTGRRGKGIIAIKTSERNGNVVNAIIVDENDDIMLITLSGMMVRTPVSGIPVVGRNTQGVRVINLKEDDKLTSMTTVEKNDEEVEFPAPEEPGNQPS